MASRNVTQAGPNARFNASTQPVGPAASRPSGGGRGVKRSFDVQDLSNSALRKIQRPASLQPRGTVDAPFRQLGAPQQAPGGARALMMTGAGSSKEESVARYDTGFGGMSEAAFAKVQTMMPGVPGADQFKMPGNKDMRFGQHAGDEYGVPYYTGFGEPGSHEAINMFRTGGVNPTSRSMKGLMFSGYDARPTELDSQRGIHGVPNTDPRRGAPTLTGGPNAPPLASAVTPSTATPRAMTEKKPYEDVNPILQAHCMTRPFAPSFAPEDHYGQFMLVHRSVASLNNVTTPKLFSGPAAASVGGEQFRYTTLSVTTFNYLCASREVDPGQDAPEVKAVDLWRNWEFQGCTINESALSTTDAMSRATEHGVEHMLNTCTGGPASVYNYWGKQALGSNVRLFFILKRVPREQLAKLAQGRPMKAEARRLISESFEKGRQETKPVYSDTLYYKLGEKKDYLTVYSRDPEQRKLHPAPFQLVPYATNSYKGVPLEMRRYRERDGSTAYGIVIEVGTSDYPLNQGRAEDGMAGMVDAGRLADAGQLRIFTTIETKC